MQLVGASRPTVYVPFLIEGMLQGVMGAIVAGALIAGAYSAVSMGLQKLSVAYSVAQFPYVPVLAILTAAGAVYGILCSTLAIRAPLKYR
jgi:cell division transport system permease protein